MTLFFSLYFLAVSSFAGPTNVETSVQGTLTQIENLADAANKEIDYTYRWDRNVKTLFQFERTSSTSAKLSVIPNFGGKYELALMQMEKGPNREKLFPMLKDQLVLELREKNGKLTAVVDDSSVIAGIPVLDILKICEAKHKPGNRCAEFGFGIQGIEAMDLALSFSEASSDLEEDDDDALFLFQFRAPLVKDQFSLTATWTVKSMFGCGGDLGDEDVLVIGRGPGRESMTSARQNAQDCR